jgi:hypothetical protein
MGFHQDTLLDVNLPPQLVTLIMTCIENSSLSVLWNGSPSAASKPTRGIHQRDPLSPYLFVLFLERLSQLIVKSVDTGAWKPFRVGKGGTKVSHLCFADNMQLFAEANAKQTETIMECLDISCASSGLRVSIASYYRPYNLGCLNFSL